MSDIIKSLKQLKAEIKRVKKQEERNSKLLDRLMKKEEFKK